MTGGIISIVFGLIVAVAGPTTGVVIARRDRSGRELRAKITGGAAGALGVCLMIYGVVQVISSA